MVSNSAKRDANGFFKVLLLSSHLLISRHPVRKSKFGACAVTGCCSFNHSENKLIYFPSNLEILGKQNQLFPSGPVIECLILHAEMSARLFSLETGYAVGEKAKNGVK